MTDMQPLKPITESHRCTLEVLRRMPIGQKVAAELKPHDIIDMARTLKIERELQPATVNQYVTYLRGPLGYAALGWGMEDVTVAPIVAAMPHLKKYNLVGKSRPRDRRPTVEELDSLLEYFRTRTSKRVKIPMADLVEFSYCSGRRIGETCRLRWGDVNGADQTCVVRDMKDPKHKKGNDHEFPLLGRAWDIVMAQPRRSDDPEERIFPYNSHSVSAAYTAAKHALGIKNLRLHDNRRETASRAFEGRINGRKYSVPEVMVITGHKNPGMLMRVYTKLHAKDLHPKDEEKTADVD